METLKAKLDEYDEAYYNRNESLVSDAVYDEMRRKYIAGTNKDLDYVGVVAPLGSVKVKHLAPLKSLSNVFNKEEIIKFFNKCDKRSNSKLKYVLEPKIDGLTVVLRYSDGILISAATRGDGKVGEDVTEAFTRSVQEAPVELPTQDPEFELLTEVYVSDEEYVNLQQYSTQRTAASAILRGSHDLGEVLSYVVHGWNNLTGLEEASYDLTKDTLRQLGLNVIESIDTFKAKQFDGEELETKLLLGIPLDGLVIKVDDLETRDLLGVTGHSPVWATAYKYPTDAASTTLNEVIWQVGRSGILTPVAVYNTVKLGGVNNSRATLHNYDEIVRLDLSIGAEIIIERGGEIIPKIISVTTHGPDGLIKPPTYCTSCRSDVIVIPATKDSATKVMCSAEDTCNGVLIGKMEYFASRPCVNILGLGRSTISQMVMEHGFNTIDEIYSSKFHDVVGTLTNGGKIQLAISLSRNVPMDKFIAGLGIPGIGQGGSVTLAQEVRTIQGLLKHDSVPEQYKTIISKMIEHGLKPTPIPAKVGIVEGPLVCITGTFDKTRDALKTILESNGYKVTDKVTKNTNFCLVGDKPSKGKRDKAISLKIAIVTSIEDLPCLI